LQAPTHDENFINHSQKAAEKLQLFVNCKKLVYCSDYYDIAEKLISSGLNKKIELFSWGSNEGSVLRITEKVSSQNETIIRAVYGSKNISVTIPFIDKASIENATHCWAYMLMEGYSNNIIDQRLQKLISIEMRLEVKEGINGCTIINDSYNSDINSLSIAIDFLEKNKEYRQKTLVLSDILQSGKQNERLVKEIASLIERRGIDRFIGIGPVLAANKKYFSDDASFFANTDAFLREYDLVNFRNEMILLKGARQFGFEKIGALLEAKAHETILSTDLNALTHNINFFKSKLPSKTRMMAMVKAFAYGSGSIEIARHLEYHRLDYLAVAYTDEGVTLRKAGITTPIMVMSPEDSNHYFLFRYNLEPEIFSLSSLKKLVTSAKEFEGIIELPVKIHIKFDSGMHRLGFAANDIEELAELLIKSKQYIQVASAFSHFSASDETEHNLFTLEQLDSFKLMASELERKIGSKFICHIANSAGALRFPDAHLDMVRIGIGLYGIDPSDAYSSELLPVATLKTKVLQIKEIAPGESVGYSRKAISKKPRTIATLAIGYADGLHRIMGNGNWNVNINGHLVPLVGNICMDMCMADITGIDNISEGDEVEIFGPNCLLQDYANAMGTIAYEALTSVSGRVKRVYIQQD
jgi:alanine racemase